METAKLTLDEAAIRRISASGVAAALSGIIENTLEEGEATVSVLALAHVAAMFEGIARGDA